MPAASAANVINVSVDGLDHAEGIVARDVIAFDGTVLLPTGVDITMFRASMRVLKRKMEKSGIKFVPLYQAGQLTEDDIESIIERVYNSEDQIIDKEKAVTVVREVNALFQKFKTSDGDRDAVVTLSVLSSDITYDLMRNPSVAFSLGKVRDADEYTFIHSFNVSVLSGYLARAMHPDDKGFIERMVLGGLLHDMGKARIPIEILNKPAPLTDGEFKIMQSHPSIGVDLARESGVSDDEILSVIVGHHEKWSGKGYPNKIAGEGISEAARIAAVADVFDALTAKRVYKQPMTSREAMSLIMKDAGVHFDSRIVRELLVGLGLYPPGSIVMLSDGRRGIVVSGGGKDLLRPVVLIQNSRHILADEEPEFVDLKEAGGVMISEYLGHGGKREMTISEMLEEASAGGKH